MSEAEIVKPKRGRPPKASLDREPMREVKKSGKWRMRASPNWETFDPTEEDTPDKLKIDKSLHPDGMSLLWVTDAIFGKPEPQRRAVFEKRGWTPVHQDDFDGQFNGMYMSKDAPGEVKHESCVLMARPKELTERARQMDQRRAKEAVSIKEQALRGGNLDGVSLDPRHPSAVSSNRITKTMERIVVPED